jgi:hypothetical protein
MVDELAAVSEGLAEKGPDFERAIGEPAGIRNRPDPAAVEVADDDLLLGELDKDGHGSRVFVAKGDPIPPGQRALPRTAAREAPRKK